MRRALTVFVAFALGGCSVIYNVDDYEVGDGTDAGPGLDGGDAGPPEVDAGPGDGGTDAGTDAGMVDAGPPVLCQSAADGCDLIIACSMPTSIAGAGESVRVPYQATNLGTVSGAGTFEVTVEMDMDGTFVEMATERFAGTVDPLGMATGEVSFVAPDWILNGATNLRCTVDSGDEVPEADEMNNTDDTMVVASGLPNLTIPFASVPGSPGNPFSVTFDIQNTGPVAVPPFQFLISGGGSSGGGTLTRQDVPGIGASTTMRVTESVSHSLSGQGAGTVFINLDPGAPSGVVVESNESDNSFTRNVTW